MKNDFSFDVVVIGGGHAGCEAAAASHPAWPPPITTTSNDKSSFMAQIYRWSLDLQADYWFIFQCKNRWKYYLITPLHLLFQQSFRDA